MLQIKTEKGDRSLEERSNFNITYAYEGEQTLSFDISTQDRNYRFLQNRGKLLYRDNRYNILKINKRKALTSISAELDMNEWKQKIHQKFEVQDALFNDVMLRILPEGWYLKDVNAAIGRVSFSLEGVSDYEILMECKKEYQIVFEYHILEKYIKVIDPAVVQQRGLYLSDELNLSSVEYKGDFTNQINRLYAYGKKNETENEDGTKETTYVTFASINDGKEYVDCTEFISDEILCAYWQDDKYTDAMELLCDAKEKVKELAAPDQAWSCNVYDLSRTNKKYQMLNFHLYDKPVLLCDGQSIVHQIVEYTEYPDTPNLNKVILSTSFKKIEGIVASIKTDVDAINQNLVGKERTINELIRDVNSNSLRIENTYTKKEIDTIQESIIQQTNDSIDLSISEVNEKIDRIDVKAIQLQMLKSGTILNTDTTSIELRAQLTENGEDITERIPEISFTWERTSNDIEADVLWNESHRHIRFLTLTYDDINVSASFQCVVTTSDYTKSSGFETITDESDILNLNVQFDTNLPRIQNYNCNEGTCYPLWDPLIITPIIWNHRMEITMSECEISWRRSDGELGEGETVSDGILHVTQNKLSETTNGMITYICNVVYRSNTAENSIDFTMVKDGTDGVDGVNGVSYYTWIRYADDANGSNISDTPQGKSYIGIAHNRLMEQESDDSADYEWSLMHGDTELYESLTPPDNHTILWFDLNEQKMKRWDDDKEEWIIINDNREDIVYTEARITETINSSIEQTKNEINLSVEHLTSAIGETTEQLHGIQNEITLTNEQTSFIKTTVDTLTEIMEGKADTVTIQEWARFDGASLELGSSNSLFKAILSNTELGFWQGNTKVAWISNNELHVVKGVITEQIQVGNWVWSDEGSAGLTLRRL